MVECISTAMLTHLLAARYNWKRQGKLGKKSTAWVSSDNPHYKRYVMGCTLTIMYYEVFGGLDSA